MGLTEWLRRGPAALDTCVFIDIEAIWRLYGDVDEEVGAAPAAAKA